MSTELEGAGCLSWLSKVEQRAQIQSGWLLTSLATCQGWDRAKFEAILQESGAKR